ncbi:MAG: Ig-like domain-containing protein, partial [Verrucomicrobiota bacterium]
TNWIMINQSVNGNDFWQADFKGTNRTWDITFNLKLGSTNYQDIGGLKSSPVTRTFRFRNPNSIVPLATTLGLNASPASPSVYGQSVVFTGMVQSNGTAATAATGYVVFSVSGTAVTTNSIVNGIALYTNNTLNAGTYLIQANYSGDSYYLPSTNTVTQVVNSANTTVSYSGTNFLYNGLAQGPGIVIVGSSGTRTTNYFGTVGTIYGSVNAPTNAGSYYVTNTIVADSNYLGTNTSFVFTITAPVPILFTNAVWLASNGGFQLSGSGPAGQSWRLFTATNLALPWTQWTLETSDTFTGNGRFNYTSPVPPNALQQFYRMVSP